MIKTLMRLKDNLRYIGVGSLAVIALLIMMWNVFPILYNYIIKGLTESLIGKNWIIVIFLIAIQIFFWIISTLLNAYEQNIKQRAMTKSENQTKMSIRKKLCELPLRFFENPKNIEILSKANRNNSVYFNTYKNIISICIMIPSIIFTVITLANMVPWTLFLLVGLCILNVLITVKCSDIEYLESVRQLEAERKRSYYKSLFYNNDVIKEIKSYNIQNWLLDKYNALSKKIFKDVFRLHIRNGSIVMLIDILSMMVKIILWGFVALKTINGEISIGNCVLFIGLWDTVISIVEEIRYNIIGIYTDSQCLRDVNSFLDFIVEETNIYNVSDLKSIELHNVSFSYPTSPENIILKDINLTFNAGKCYLILGENGAGKSTLIKLILKHYIPSQGEILLNNEYNISNIRELKVGYMAQEDIHFSLSLKENILFGCEYEKEKFTYAIEKAGLRSLIEKLPEKEDTILGNAYDDGREISGGQWQRISFARLLYNESDIVILDEPTANLDPIAERRLYMDIQNIFYNKIVLLISHRLSSVNIADSIVFLENGMLKGFDSHSQLLENCESYKKLFEMQQSIIEGVQ